MLIVCYSIHETETISVKTPTTFTTVSHYDPPPPPPSPSGRYSSTCDDAGSEDSDTDITTPRTNHDYKLSPTFKAIKSEHPASRNMTEFANIASAVARSPERSAPISPRSPRYQQGPHHSAASEHSHRHHSIDGRNYAANVYATIPGYVHRYEPYPSQRPRSYSSPNHYDAYSSAAQHSSYYDTVREPHSPPVVHLPHYSTPPSPHDRRRAHILSEQKRRESINGGFVELKQRLTSEPITRALSSSSHVSSDADSDAKPKDTNDILGGGSRESKASTLRKAVKALEVLADKVNDLQIKVAMLRRSGQENDKTAMQQDEQQSHDMIAKDGCSWPLFIYVCFLYVRSLFTMLWHLMRLKIDGVHGLYSRQKSIIITEYSFWDLGTYIVWYEMTELRGIVCYAGFCEYSSWL